MRPSLFPAFMGLALAIGPMTDCWRNLLPPVPAQGEVDALDVLIQFEAECVARGNGAFMVAKGSPEGMTRLECRNKRGLIYTEPLFD